MRKPRAAEVMLLGFALLLVSQQAVAQSQNTSLGRSTGFISINDAVSFGASIGAATYF